MEALTLVLKKREGEELTEEEIRFLIGSYSRNEIPDYQMSALLMAIFFRGMSFEETGHLTRAMIDSGERLDLDSLDGPLIDKHSTGGVGDKVSLVLAPLAAACGIQVPMMSGRSLGHTGGTLDKLESITGYRTDLSQDQFLRIVKEAGFAMMGQSEKVVPADRKMYALRDVTATVESIPLITASILSKKFAEGADGLVFDVKTGSGAFMRSPEKAEQLARSLCATAASLDKRAVAVLTNMDQPLGRMVGNFLEVCESIDCLQGKGPADLLEVTVRLTARMLIMGGICSSLGEAEGLCKSRLDDGSAWNRFAANVELQGGDTKLIENPGRGPRAAVTKQIVSEASGFVQSVDAFSIGTAATLLGAGRIRLDDRIVPSVGLELRKKTGDEVGEGEILCIVHAEDAKSIEDVLPMVEKAYKIGDSRVEIPPLIINEIGT
jgi:pyrimidine-nucleoside phosphorylase